MHPCAYADSFTNIRLQHIGGISVQSTYFGLSAWRATRTENSHPDNFGRRQHSPNCNRLRNNCAATLAGAKSAGLDYVSVGDFSLYDPVLDHAVLLGAIPARFRLTPRKSRPSSILRWREGNAAQPALEMTVVRRNYHLFWFPELSPEQQFARPEQILVHLDEALLWVAKPNPYYWGRWLYTYQTRYPSGRPSASKLAARSAAARVRGDFARHRDQRRVVGANRRTDFGTGFTDRMARCAAKVLANLSNTPLKILLATYFENIGSTCPPWPAARRRRTSTPCAHRSKSPFVRDLPAHQVLSLGVVNGRNIWANDLSESVAVIQAARARSR